MATVEDTLITISTYLGDWEQTFWTKDLLIELMREAHRELQLELNLNGLPVIKKKSAIAVIPQNTTDWSVVPPPNQMPNDIIGPLEMWERDINDANNDDWDLMVQKSWEPEREPITDLIYWTWRQNKILFCGATVNKQVKLYYNGGIPLPTADQDDLGFTLAELFIAPKTAELAADTIGGKPSMVAKMAARAEKMLYKVIAANVREEQYAGIRRRPYRHGRRPYAIR